jgi:hypothetical protein
LTISTKRTVAIGTTIVTALLLAGCEYSCSIGNTVSAEELDKQVRISFEDETGVLLTSIECEEADADVGSEINCEATNENDLELTIEGTVTSYDSDTEKVKFDWEVVSATAPGDNFAVAAKSSLASQSSVQLDNVACPDRIELEPGNKIDCTAEDINGNDRDLVLTLTDDEGGFNVRLKPLATKPADSKAEPPGGS